MYIVTTEYQCASFDFCRYYHLSFEGHGPSSEGCTDRSEGHTGCSEGCTGRSEGRTGCSEGRTGRSEGRTGCSEGRTGRSEGLHKINLSLLKDN